MSPTRRRREIAAARRCAIATLLCLLAFAGLSGTAMALYPGGNWLDRTAVGHRFFANFFCDLTQPISLSGVPNPLGARCAQFGMLFFALALAGFFWLVPAYFTRDSPAKRWVHRLGKWAFVSFVAVPLTPSERFGNVHAALSLVSGGFGIASAVLVVHALLCAERRALAALGAASLTVGTADIVLFAYHLGGVAPPPLIVPAAQKIAALLVGAWIAAVAAGLLFDGSALARQNEKTGDP